MTQQEVSETYRIPRSVLQQYELWRLCGADGQVSGAWQYGDEDLRRLSVIMTLHDIGFSAGETERYMRLLLEQAESAGARLCMLEEKRAEALGEIHAQQRRLARLDYLRHEIQKSIDGNCAQLPKKGAFD